MNKLKITESVSPRITPVRSAMNTFKIKKKADKTTIVYVR